MKRAYVYLAIFFTLCGLVTLTVTLMRLSSAPLKGVAIGAIIAVFVAVVLALLNAFSRLKGRIVPDDPFAVYWMSLLFMQCCSFLSPSSRDFYSVLPIGAYFTFLGGAATFLLLTDLAILVPQLMVRKKES